MYKTPALFEVCRLLTVSALSAVLGYLPLSVYQVVQLLIAFIR